MIRITTYAVQDQVTKMRKGRVYFANIEHVKILEYVLACDLLLCKTCFKKREGHLITYRSGNTGTQIDIVLLIKSLRNLGDRWKGD